MAASARRLETQAFGSRPNWETKRASVALSRVSETGVFEGYASLFGVMDTSGDIVAPGAFTTTLKKRGAAGVKMLWQHQADEPIGVWTQIGEDARGLKVTGRLDLSVARAREALSLIRSGALDGLSIGFRTLRAANDRATGARRLLDVDLWEISIVTFPALPQARIVAVKRATPLPAAARRRAAPLAEIRAKLARLRTQTAALNFEMKLRRLSRSFETRYSPSQPRAPAGSPDGRQWTSGGGGGANSGNYLSFIPEDQIPDLFSNLSASSGGADQPTATPRYSDTVSVSPFGQVLNDSTPEQWKPGAQYAQLFIENLAKTGSLEVDATTNLLAATLGQVANTIPEAPGSKYGVAVHTAFAFAMRLLNLPRIEIEQSFDFSGEITRYGAEDSVRTDVLLRDEEKRIIAVWDVKTNTARLGCRRVRELRDRLRLGDDIPIMELHVQRGRAILR